MFEILDGFSSVWVLIYRHSKSSFVQVTLNFKLEITNICSKHSIMIITQILLNIIYWPFFKMLIKRLHNNSHQKETIHDKLVFFSQNWLGNDCKKSEQTLS